MSPVSDPKEDDQSRTAQPAAPAAPPSAAAVPKAARPQAGATKADRDRQQRDQADQLRRATAGGAEGGGAGATPVVSIDAMIEGISPTARRLWDLLVIFGAIFFLPPAWSYVGKEWLPQGISSRNLKRSFAFIILFPLTYLGLFYLLVMIIDIIIPDWMERPALFLFGA